MKRDNAKDDLTTFIDHPKTAQNHFFNIFQYSMGNIEWGKISRLFQLKRRLIFPHPLNWLLLFGKLFKRFVGFYIKILTYLTILDSILNLCSELIDREK